MNAPVRHFARRFARLSVCRSFRCLVHRFLVLPLALLACAIAAHAAPVLMISIDGLKPEAILDAAKHGLKVPNLRASQ